MSASWGANNGVGAVGQMYHPALGPVRYSAQEVSDDPDTQVAQVIGIMREYAVADSKSPEVTAATYMIAGAGGGDPVDDVWTHVRGRMHFVRDEDTAAPLADWYPYPIVETLVRPKDMAIAESAQGDCDDYSMYGASLLAARGVPVAFCTVAADAQAPDIFSHVYLVAYPTSGRYAGARVPLDLSHGPYPGWETENHFGKRAEWPLAGGAGWLLLAGLGLLAYSTRNGGRH